MQGEAKGLWVFPHRRGGGDVLPHSQLPLDVTKARDRRTALCAWSYPCGPSRSSRFFLTLLNSYHFRQDLSPTSAEYEKEAFREAERKRSSPFHSMTQPRCVPGAARQSPCRSQDPDPSPSLQKTERLACDNTAQRCAFAVGWE